MVNVTYVESQKSVEVNNPHTLLTNRKGEYVSFGIDNNSNYDGMFFLLHGNMFKALANISPLFTVEDLEIGLGVKRSTKKYFQQMTLTDEGLVVECDGKFLLTADCKKLYDESDQGRVYKINFDESGDIRLVNVHYSKYKDGSLSSLDYEIHICIATTLRTTVKGDWKKVQYSYDDRRGTKSTPWVYDVVTLEGEGVITVATAETMQDAKDRALDLFKNRKKMVQLTALERMPPTVPVQAQRVWHAFDALMTRNGIIAGLPWFFQYWSRDELTASGGLLFAKRYAQMIKIVDKWYGLVQHDGTLPAIYPSHGLASSDAPGWLGKRTLDLLMKLSDENLLHQIPRETIEHWRDASGSMIEKCATRIRDGLVWSEANTTWMDTSFADDGRAGARIEIQALFLALCEAHAYLCTITKTQNKHLGLQKAVQQGVHKLVQNGVLLDGLHADGRPDFTVRPNIFIAAYVAPKLFSKKEWKSFIDAILPRLWLSWGGLSSIATNDQNFHGTYTGESVASYHRGDSWYFVNNIAAIVMCTVDKQVYHDKIQAITNASIRDMLELGYLGHCSELSSANVQEPVGCFSQAWSASTLLELLCCK